MVMGPRVDRESKKFKSKSIAQGKGVLKIQSKYQVIWCERIFKGQLTKIGEKRKH